MGKLVVSQFITLDGVVEDPGGSENLDRGGWAFRLDRGEEGDRFKLDEAMASAALLLGRRTYQGFAWAWPSRAGEFADKFNTMPKYVVSSTLEDPDWNNTTVIDGDVAEAVSRLKEDLDGDLLVDGSVQVVRTLAEHDLVDEWRPMVYPTVLGGKRLFGESREAAALRLVESRPAGDTLILVYLPSRRPE